MKLIRTMLIAALFLGIATALWAGGRTESAISGPPYDVATVMRILSSEELYRQGYLQREVDKNGDGISDETGKRIYVGALHDFQDANGDGLDDETGGELPLGLHNRLVDRNGDGIVDGTDEDVGRYINRVRIEARVRYEQGEGEGDRLQTRTESRSQDRAEEQTRNGESVDQPSSSASGGSNRTTAPVQSRTGSN